MIGAKYHQLAMRVDALQLRERTLLLTASVVILFFLFESLGLQPLLNRQQILLQDIKEKEMQIEALHARSSFLNNTTANEPVGPIEQLQQELSNLEPKLQFRLESMLAPNKAASILEQVISHEEGLTLNAVSTRLTPLTSLEADVIRGTELDNINRYEMELQLEGGFLDTLSYLRNLEALPWNFFWSEISFETTDYPNAVVNLEIYTLGQLSN